VIGSTRGARRAGKQNHTVEYGLINEIVTAGLGLAGNPGKECWPDVKRKVFQK
jgi:hypothetical protein